MATAARQVQLAMRDRLIAAATASGPRVYAGRAWPIATFPATRVVLADEALDAEADDITWPADRTHRLLVDVSVFVRDVDDVDGALDAGVEQVLLALEGTQVAARLAPLNCVSRATSVRRQVTTEGEASAGIATVRFEVLFGTRSNNPSTIL